ncbi:hypothetical protein ACTPEM_24875, partial [Clostridioides difficile]
MYNILVTDGIEKEAARKLRELDFNVIEQFYEKDVLGTNLSKTYNPKDFEARLYKKWMDEGYFKSKPNPDKKPFTIMMP